MRPRFLVAFALAVSLVLASLSLAAARGQAPAAGQVQICTGMGVQAVPVDAEGKPAGNAHVCPDGVSAIAAVALPVLPSGVDGCADGESLCLPRVLGGTGTACPFPQARDPPAGPVFR
ncbi:hypothetical protein [Rhodovulum imhoffii]|nr:hypothetical protein [Rhodovulum imhoffii]